MILRKSTSLSAAKGLRRLSFFVIFATIARSATEQWEQCTDWSAKDMQEKGYIYVMKDDVKIGCVRMGQICDFFENVPTLEAFDEGENKLKEFIKKHEKDDIKSIPFLEQLRTRRNEISSDTNFYTICHDELRELGSLSLDDTGSETPMEQEDKTENDVNKKNQETNTEKDHEENGNGENEIDKTIPIKMMKSRDNHGDDNGKGENEIVNKKNQETSTEKDQDETKKKKKAWYQSTFFLVNLGIFIGGLLALSIYGYVAEPDTFTWHKAKQSSESASKDDKIQENKLD